MKDGAASDRRQRAQVVLGGHRINPPSMVLVAAFGSLLFALDDLGLHIRIVRAQ